MKKYLNIALIICLFLIVPFLTPVSAGNYQQTSSNQCVTPTVTFAIKAQPPDQYNVTTFTVAQGACIAVAFKNADPGIAHSFTIDNNSAINVEFFTIYLLPNATQTVNFQAPSVNTTIKYYCAIPGHEAQGQHGNLTVGSGTNSTNTNPTSTSAQIGSSPPTNNSGPSQQTITSTPSFEAVSVILGVASPGIIVSKIKRKRK